MPIPLQTLEAVYSDAIQMRDYIHLLNLLRKVRDNKAITSRSVLQQLQNLLAEMASRDLVLQRTLKTLNADPHELPADVLLDIAKTTIEATQRWIKPMEIAYSFKDDILKVTAADLRTALFFLWYIDLTGGNQLRVCQRPGCGKSFTTKRKNRFYCELECARKDSLLRFRQREKDQKLKKRGKRKCQRPDCAKLFLPTRKNNIYCSSRCAHVVAQRARRQRERLQFKKGGKHHGPIQEK